MVTLDIHWNPARIFPLLVVFAVLPPVYAAPLWSNPLPTSNAGFDAAPLYGSLCDSNLSPGTCPGSPVEPFTLGDQFTLASASTITSVTIYEVGDVAMSSSTSTTVPSGDAPTTEFSSISLYLGADGSGLSLASSSYTSQFVQLGGTANFDSVSSPGTYYPIYAITFSGLDVALGSGLNDFAIAATGGDFALMVSDPNHSGVTESSASLCPSCGFVYFFNDGPGSTPLATYQYAPGSVTDYTQTGALDSNVIINGTAATPEPSTFGLIALGLVGMGTAWLRRALSPRV